MAAGNTTKRAAVAEFQPPAPAGCAAHERDDWLPADLPLPWLTELRTKHVELAHGWASAVDQIGAARDERADLEREHRQAVRSALAVGDPAPARSAGLDPTILEARVSIAVEDAGVARDALAEHVLDCLAELRAHRGDLHPHLGAFSAHLLDALARGASNQRAIVAERLRRQIAELEADGPAIEVFTDQSPAATPELEPANA